jgi:hypothetical protein
MKQLSNAAMQQLSNATMHPSTPNLPNFPYLYAA